MPWDCPGEIAGMPSGISARSVSSGDGDTRQKNEVADVAKSFAIFRLVNPAKMLKFAAGRETTMKDFQGLLMLAGMNSMITGGYLTTRGRSIAEDRAFLASLNCFISAGSGGQMQ